MRFFTDTKEIEYQMDILRDDTKAGVIKESIPFLDLVVLALNTHVKSFKDKEDFWLFSQCRSCSDVLHNRPFCKYEDTRVALDALLSVLSLKEGAALAVPEDQESLLLQVDDLEWRLKNVLLYKFQGPSVAASILRKKAKGKKQKTKKQLGIYSAICSYVKKAKGNIKCPAIWSSIENYEWHGRNQDNCDEVTVYIAEGRIFQSVDVSNGLEASTKSISYDTFRRYVSEAIKDYKKTRK